MENSGTSRPQGPREFHATVCDHRHPEYRNSKKKDEILDVISPELGMKTGPELKKLWQHLRLLHSREGKEQKMTIKSGAPKLPHAMAV